MAHGKHGTRGRPLCTTRHAQEVLGVVDDYLHCVQLSVANEVVNAMPDLEAALHEQFGMQPLG